MKLALLTLALQSVDLSKPADPALSAARARAYEAVRLHPAAVTPTITFRADDLVYLGNGIAARARDFQHTTITSNWEMIRREAEKQAPDILAVLRNR